MSETTHATTSSAVRWGRIATVALAFIFAIGSVAQIFIAGLGLFESATYWTDHVDLGRMLGLPALLIPIAALVGRVGRQLTMLSVAVTVLYILQMVLANVDNGYIGAFHALNAFAVTAVAFQTGFRTLALVRGGEAGAVTGAAMGTGN